MRWVQMTEVAKFRLLARKNIFVARLIMHACMRLACLLALAVCSCVVTVNHCRFLNDLTLSADLI